ncbi:hypothetical protein EDB81DRAFT_836445 [Dactylonectria macrodidyma]|uniref:PD-(D/E)XK nuclease-like domain-containing protein n=1 Tax=Dactylonectria macrodidyma TaxID=307937 RepID=A0A9P9JJ85_9HYPO|nr:hypothetical protein EDB81DRAFT_836445 [Dactylonectria macrodidyma]
MKSPRSINDHQHHPLLPSKSCRKRQATISVSPQTPKRRRVQDRDVDSDVDADETPRVSGTQGRQTYQPQLRTASPATSMPPLSEYQSTQSQSSRQSSPPKQLAVLELNPEGIEIRALSPDDKSLPSALSKLLLDFEMCSSGFHIIPSSIEPEIKERAKKDPKFHAFLPHMYASPQERDALGSTPPIDEVAKLVKDAAEAQASRQNEAAWNMMVHWPLLDNAIYNRWRQNQLVGFACCTTANIIKEYLPISCQSKMVDFGIYILPEAEPSSETTEAIQALRQVLPYNVINHTDFFPLRDLPLAVSIESKKRYCTNLEMAELQLGTWHAAQWKFLGDLVGRSGGSFDGLPFLPAVIVNGHDWSFAATTKAGRKTILWMEKGFGSTDCLVGVFRAVCGLQRLAKWAREVYWPWYKRNALGISTV